MVVKTLVPPHNFYRIFKNSRASVMILTMLFKQRSLERNDYMVKDLKHDVEQELRVHVAYSKCKRA